MMKICDMPGVREYAEGFTVELCRDEGRLVIVAKNQNGYDCTSVDLFDLIGWLRTGKPEGCDALEADAILPAHGFDLTRN